MWVVGIRMNTDGLLLKEVLPQLGQTLFAGGTHGRRAVGPAQEVMVWIVITVIVLL